MAVNPSTGPRPLVVEYAVVATSEQHDARARSDLASLPRDAEVRLIVGRRRYPPLWVSHDLAERRDLRVLIEASTLQAGEAWRMAIESGTVLPL